MQDDLASVIHAWVHGWATSRATPAPIAIPGGWQVDVNLPGHRRRYVLHEDDERALVRLGRQECAPGTWIKIATDPGRLRAALAPEWKTSDPGHLMTTTYGAESGTLPPPYVMRERVSGQVVSVVVVDPEDQVAASGRLAVTDRFGIIDQVETTPAHRRRGLGRAVMHTLALHARRRGAHTGVLVATDDGRDLYRSLGWAVRAPLAAAYVPEPPGT